MKKHTMFPNLIQKIISPKEIMFLKEIVGYHDTARKLDVPALIDYLVTASMNEWKSYRHCSDVGPCAGLVKVDYSTLSKKSCPVGLFLDEATFSPRCVQM